MNPYPRRWWAQYARLYDRLWDGPLTAELAEQVQHLAGTGDGPVLDVGTGTGLIAVRLTGRPTVGIDPDGSMLARAAHRQGLWVRGDACHPPFAQRSFALVVAVNVLHLCDSPERVAASVATLVRPGGRLVLCWVRETAGPWQILRAEVRRGMSGTGAILRFAGRLLMGVCAVVPGGPRRHSDIRVLAAVSAAASNAERTHEVILDGLVHLVSLTPVPPSAADQTN